jgi:hypothetical protein
VARMSNGDYFLMAYPQREPAAVVARTDDGALRDALRTAFGYPTNTPGGGTGGGSAAPAPRPWW